MSGPVTFTAGKFGSSTPNFTRPNDSNPYTIGDVVADSTSAATVITFPRVARMSGGALIVSATLFSSAAQATKLEGRLFIFNAAPVMQNDNAAFAPTDAELRACLHVIEFPASSWVAGNPTVGATGNAMCNAQNLWLPVTVAASAAGADEVSLYGVLTAQNAYTPVAQERFDIRLGLML